MARKAAFGRSSQDSFASYDPTTQSLKIHRSLPKRGLTGSYLTLPLAGLMRNGVAYQRQPLVPHTFARGSTLLPTPIATDVREATMARRYVYRKRGGKDGGTGLMEAVGGIQHINHREWMMGFPLDWTRLGERDSALLETPLFRKLLISSERS